jgi:hypothetical protein
MFRAGGHVENYTAWMPYHAERPQETAFATSRFSV